jgi:hypothetical protein
MSASIVTGAYAMVSSALNYWTNLALSNGYTADAYLNTPVGSTSLNFGKHAFKNLSAWNNPSGINGILAWTAVPAVDSNDGGSLSTPPTLPGGQVFRSFASVNVGNAIAAVEGYVAINYLLSHHDFQYIDTNHDGLITAQENQIFVDNAAAMGLPEAGAMAALLGGTATYGAVQGGLNNLVFNENPDDPAALQRRFNFFDYAADGQLNGSITMNELKMLSRTLLPAPDAYNIVDRQRASANGFLVDPTAQRNFVALQRIVPKFEWVPKSAVKNYKNISPMKFKVDKGKPPGFSFPLYTLFDPASSLPQSSTTQPTVVSGSRSALINGVNVTVDWLSAVPTTPATSSSPYTLTSTAPAASDAKTTVKPAGTVTPAPAASTPPAPAQTPASGPLQSVINSLTTLAQNGATITGPGAPATSLPPAQPIPAVTSVIGVVGGSGSSSQGSSASAGTAADPSASASSSSSPAPSSSSSAATAPPNSAAALTPPPQAASPVKKTTKVTKSKSFEKQVSGFFNDLGKSIKKAFH